MTGRGAGACSAAGEAVAACARGFRSTVSPRLASGVVGVLAVGVAGGAGSKLPSTDRIGKIGTL